MKENQNLGDLIQQIKLARQQKKTVYQNFIKRLGPLKEEPIMDYILKKYTQFKPQKFQKLVQNFQVLDIIQIRNLILKTQWQMPDYITLIWVASKVLQLNRRNGSLSFQFDQEDYNLIDQIMNCQSGQAYNILQILRSNPYTDRWFKQQFALLSQIYKQQLKNGRINWQKVAEKLQKINTFLYSAYRCAIQCQKKIKYTKTQYRQWTQQQDDQLLKIAEATQHTRPNWSDFQKYFEGRSGIALKTRLYILVSKLRIANPYPYQLSNEQLIRKKNEGNIDISKSNYSNSVIRKSQNLPKPKDLAHMRLLIDQAHKTRFKNQNVKATSKFKNYVNTPVEQYETQKNKNNQQISQKKQWNLLISQFEKHIISIKRTLKDLKRKFHQQYQAKLMKKIKKSRKHIQKRLRKNIGRIYIDSQQSDSESQDSQNSYLEQNDIIFYD